MNIQLLVDPRWVPLLSRVGAVITVGTLIDLAADMHDARFFIEEGHGFNPAMIFYGTYSFTYNGYHCEGYISDLDTYKRMLTMIITQWWK